MKRSITLHCGIQLILSGTGDGIGLLEKGLERESGIPEAAEANEANAAYDALESLVLAHAIAGIDVEAPAYQDGLQTSLEAIANNL